jgi:hypothetical protein
LPARVRALDPRPAAAVELYGHPDPPVRKQWTKPDED